MSLASTLGARFRAEFAGRVVAVVSSAAMIVALAHLLHPDTYGVVFLAISVLGIVKRFSKLGVAKSAARYIATYRETDPGQLAHILRFSFFLNAGTILVVCLLLLLGHGHVAAWLGEPELASLLRIGVFLIAFWTLLVFARETLQGFEAIQASATLLAFDRTARLVFVVGLVVLGFGAIGAIAGYALAYGVSCAVGLSYLYFQYYRRLDAGDLERGLRRRIAAYNVPLTATSTAYVLDKHVDTVLVGFFVGPVGVAFYTIARQIVTFLQTPIRALGFTISPTFETQKSKGNIDTAARVYEQALAHGLLLYLPAAAGLALVAEPTIEHVFGEEYLDAVPVVQVLAGYVVLLAVTEVTSDGLDFLGLARGRAVIKGVTALLNVLLNVGLIPIFGVVGAAVATVITFAIYTGGNLYLIGREFDLRVRWLLRHLAGVLAVTGLMSALLFPVVTHVTGLVTLVAVVGLGAMLWAVVVTATGLLDVRRVVSVLS